MSAADPSTRRSGFNSWRTWCTERSVSLSPFTAYPDICIGITMKSVGGKNADGVKRKARRRVEEDEVIVTAITIERATQTRLRVERGRQPRLHRAQIGVGGKQMQAGPLGADDQLVDGLLRLENRVGDGVRERIRIEPEARRSGWTADPCRRQARAVRAPRTQPPGTRRWSSFPPRPFRKYRRSKQPPRPVSLVQPVATGTREWARQSAVTVSLEPPALSGAPQVPPPCRPPRRG